MRSLILCAVMVFACAIARAQEPASLDLGYKAMYGLRFDDAHQIFEQYEREHPGDPLGPVSNAAAYLFQEFDRMRILQSELFADTRIFESRGAKRPDETLKEAFESELGRSHELAAAYLTKNPNDVNALFAQVMEEELRADYAALIEKRDVAALKFIKSGRTVAEKLLKIQATYYDAYVALGAENYLLSQRSAPVRWMLKVAGAQTDKEAGVKDLKLAAEKGRYLRPFARLLLAIVALRDKDRKTARIVLEELSGEFPSNMLYREELAKLQ